MPHRDWKQRVEDILEALERIESYTQGMTFDAFKSNSMAVDAVVRNLTVIGEAARHIPPEAQERYPHVPWAEMRAIRNILTHEYFGVSLPILWETIARDLPPLSSMLKDLLTKESGPDRE